MHYPNSRQWWAIWAGAIVAFLCIIDALYAVGLGVAIITVLLAWQLSSPGAAKSEQDSIYCGECGNKMPATWKHCQECGAESWKKSGAHI